MKRPPGYLQDLIDKARKAQAVDKHPDAIDALIEAVVFLAQAQAQVMRQFDDAQASRTDILIGGTY
jgi:hypothetical protein